MSAPLDAVRLDWVADRCLRLAWPDDAQAAARVARARTALSAAGLPALLDLVPAYASVLVHFDLARLDAPRAERAVRDALARAPTRPTHAPPEPRCIDVPVCYGGVCGPDLEEVARHAGLAADQVCARHAAAAYQVRFLGFAPGFPYLEGLPPELATPRLARPRLQVPAGSVAIAGTQAGIYPRATPGGWRLLGRTPLTLFDAQRTAPALLGAGDRVRFVPIAHAEHLRLAAQAPAAAAATHAPGG